MCTFCVISSDLIGVVQLRGKDVVIFKHMRRAIFFSLKSYVLCLSVTAPAVFGLNSELLKAVTNFPHSLKIFGRPSVSRIQLLSIYPGGNSQCCVQYVFVGNVILL